VSFACLVQQRSLGSKAVTVCNWKLQMLACVLKWMCCLSAAVCCCACVCFVLQHKPATEAYDSYNDREKLSFAHNPIEDLSVPNAQQYVHRG